MSSFSYINHSVPSLGKYSQNMENKGVGRTRSFRYEDYNTRRVFLRSYPLQWGGEESQCEENNEEEAKVTNHYSYEKKPVKKKPFKQIISSVLHCRGDTIYVLRRFKHKLTVYAISCAALSLKSPTALISAKSGF